MLFLFVSARLMRANFVDLYSAATDAVAPIYPRNSRLLVTKYRVTYQVGDVVVFHSNNLDRLGIVAGIHKQRGDVILLANDKLTHIKSDIIVGRVFYAIIEE